MPKRRGLRKWHPECDSCQDRWAGEKLQNIGSSVENVGKKFLPVTAAASSNANTNSPWWARRSSTVRLAPVRWGSRQRIRKIVSAVQQFVNKLNSMDWISKRRSCPWYYIGLDWDREKWRGSVASKFIRGGEKNAVKYADKIIYRKSMMRRTFLTSALDMPEIMLYIYSKSWKLQFSASSSIIIIEDYYLQTFLHSLSGFPSCWSPSVYSR